jgi:Tol biopolymer transport system component
VDLSLAGEHADKAEYLPSFSPDGKYIVFGSIHEAKIPRNSHNAIFRMDTNGGSLKRLTKHPYACMYPVWIPSGN